MKKLFFHFAFVSALALMVTSCDLFQPNTPSNPGGGKTNPQDTTATTPQDTTTVTPQDTTTVTPPDTTVTYPDIPVPASFPKKHLIEEFTGQGCGYCPYGMDCVHDFMANDTNWVLILHHDGFSPDYFTIKESSTITKKMGVTGAPSITVDRAQTKNGVVFHPAYLPYFQKSQFESTTYASVNISNTYDAASRSLKVNVYGAICDPNHPTLKLNVVVIESGMIGWQSDFYNTFEGWEEFCHTNAARAFLTSAEGDALNTNENNIYSMNYQLTMNAEWKPENCMVVAFLTEDFKPVVQVEQRPVVAGTKGGADIKHGGIKAVPVDDWYPEPSATAAPTDYSGNASESLTVSEAYYTPYSAYGYNYWRIIAYSANQTLKVNYTDCIPFANIYVFTELSQTEIPTGTYKLDTSMKPGTAYAGFRDDQTFTVDGSNFYFTSKAYFNNGYLVPEAEWLIASGTLTITNSGWTLDGKARNGSDIHLVGTTAIKNEGRQMPPRKPSANTQQQQLRQISSQIR